MILFLHSPDLCLSCCGFPFLRYISITAGYTPEWERWWKSPEDVEMVQFMGKDNVPFHTVIFPATQLGTGDRWTMMKNIRYGQATGMKQ